MEDWLREIFGWLPSGGTYYWLIGAISFLESLVVVGIFVPGSVLIVFAGFLAAHGKGVYSSLVLSATLGAVAGDLISYWAGARFGTTLLHRPLFRKRQALVQHAELFFVAHGGKSVFIGRFVGLLRPFIPFVAGAGRMAAFPFTFFVLFSGILWGFAYPGLGYFFGASWKLVQLWTGRFSVFIAIVATLLILDAVFWKWGAPRLSRAWSRAVDRCTLFWNRAYHSTALTELRRRYPGCWDFLADRLTLRSGSGIFLTVGFLASILFAALFLLVVRTIRLQTPLLQLDNYIHLALQSVHHPVADRLFLIITLFGSWPVLFALGGLLLLWLLLRNRDFSALFLCIGIGGGKLLIDLLIRLFERSGPAARFTVPDVSAGHAFLASVCYGLAVYMLLDHLENWRSRFNLVFSGTLLVLLIGVSGLYLGINWFSEVLGAFALAAIWLTILVTASEMRRRSAGEFPWPVGWQPLKISRAVRIVLMSIATLVTSVAIVLQIMDGLSIIVK